MSADLAVFLGLVATLLYTAFVLYKIMFGGLKEWHPDVDEAIRDELDRVAKK